MPTEKSAGAIIYRKENGSNLYLILYRKAHEKYKELWDFPRGLVEKEKDKETALREIHEETGISDAKIISGFKETYTIFFRNETGMVRKEIVLFLAETNTKQIRLSEEHDDYKWCTFEEGLNLLTHKNSKDALKKAEKHINGLLTRFFG